MKRTDFEHSKANLEGFNVLTDKWQILQHRLVNAKRAVSFLGQESSLDSILSLFEDNVLTVLADIERKKFDGYRMNFSCAKGTKMQNLLVLKLEKDIKEWIRRLDAFVLNLVSASFDESCLVSIAKEIRNILYKSEVQSRDYKDDHRFYNILRNVRQIQDRAEVYAKRIEESGDSDPAVSLLLSYINNYCQIASRFNGTFIKFPDYYRKYVLKSFPEHDSTDSAYLLVMPKEDVPDFCLAKGTEFCAGDIVYKTDKKESIGHLNCAGTKLLSLKAQNKRKYPVGWQVESSLFVLEEGQRDICIRVKLDSGVNLSDIDINEGWTLQYSSADGWSDISTECKLSEGLLYFHFVVERDFSVPAQCSIDIHGIETEYPVVRILTIPQSSSYQWAKDISFTEISINVAVNGIRSFTFYNELGEVDTTQTFAVFGLQAEKGAWFVFGNEEMGIKPLKEVVLNGTWQKIPDSRAKFNERYNGYGIGVSDFSVSTETWKNERWNKVGEQQLFVYDEKGILFPASFRVEFGGSKLALKNENDKSNGLFRIVLLSPEIGFGSEKYRNLFVKVMMENSKCKKDAMQEIPKEPCVPYLTDVELSYKAEATLCFSDTAFCENENKGREIKLTRVMEFSDKETFPMLEMGTQPLVPSFGTDEFIYFSFSNACGRNRLRMYLDMNLPVYRIPYEIARPGQKVSLDWELWNGKNWILVPDDTVIVEETNGFTQSGFIEIIFDGGIKLEWLDCDGLLWLRAGKRGDTSACLHLKNVWTNCIKVSSKGFVKETLPAGSIQSTVSVDERIAGIVQPFPTFGGVAELSEEQRTIRLTNRLHHRQRAVTQKDYELLLLELFPEVDMVQCITISRKGTGSLPQVCLVVFSRSEDSRYYLSSAWKLTEMEQSIKHYAPASVQLQVTNPQYEKVIVRCCATLHFKVEDKGKVQEHLVKIINNYFASWQTNDTFPEPGRVYYIAELYSRIVNHEDVKNVVTLEINNKKYQVENGFENIKDVISGKEVWSVLLPKIEIELLEPDDGIEGNCVGGDFVIS